MNLQHYQEFRRAFSWLKFGGGKPLVRSFPKKIVEQGNFATGEWIEGYGTQLNQRIELDLERAKFFEIDDRTKRAMLMTNIPKDKEVLSSLRLPYPAIFLDLELTPDDDDIEYSERVVGILISEQQLTNTDRFFFVFFIRHFTDENGRPAASVEQFKISFTDIKSNMEYAKGTKKTISILERLIVNTILFINEPEVEWVIRPRDAKSQERRTKQGKMPLPESRIVRLTGTIKKYFDTFGHNFDGSNYSHRFDVRGTWRHFRSKFYTRLHTMKAEELSKEGYKVKDGVPCKWIAPFLKGQGLHIKKIYSLEKPKEDNEIGLEDIEPLEKPLRELRK